MIFEWQSSNCGEEKHKISTHTFSPTRVIRDSRRSSISTTSVVLLRFRVLPSETKIEKKIGAMIELNLFVELEKPLASVPRGLDL